MKSPIFILALLSASLTHAAPVAELIDGREYPAVLQQEIGLAKKSITACLYMFSLNVARGDSMPMRVVEALVAAKGRGVKVEVILDGVDEFWMRDGEGDKNTVSYEYLRERGVDVFLSSATATVHAKAVVFDGVTVLSGSSNWSETAFGRNVEINTLVRDPAVAREALAVIQAAGRMKKAEGRFVELPAAFLTGGHLSALVRAENAIDIYLWLLKESGGKEAVRVDYGRLIDHIGLTEGNSERTRYKIRKLLERLRSEGLIRFDALDFAAPEVRLVPFPGEVVRIPEAYWDGGWHRRLGMPGKAMYWVGLHRSARSPVRPRWSAAQETISRDYGLKMIFISHGTTALRRANLVEVEYDSPPTSPGDRRKPSFYTPKPLYDPATIPQTLERLERTHGREKLARAQKWAALVYEDFNMDAVETMILLENQYGVGRVEEIARVLAQLKGDNPRRSFPYFIAAVKGSGTKEFRE